MDSEEEHEEALKKTGFWGTLAAGVLFLSSSTGRLLGAHRSKKVTEPGTYGTWGGAGDAGESPEEIARREAGREETGYDGDMRLIPLTVFRHPSGFQYHNFLAVVDTEFAPVLNWETQGCLWVDSIKDIPRPHHPGLTFLLEHSRPEISTLMERYQHEATLVSGRAAAALAHIDSKKTSEKVKIP